MRYSIVHHDVRSKYGLSLCEYLVIDSIHQLSHQYPTSKSNVQIAEFIGVDEGTVRKGKKVGISKGLLQRMGENWATTPEWFEAVTFAGSRNNSEPPRNSSENVGIIPSTPYIKNIKNNDEILIVSTEPPKKKTSTSRYDDMCRWLQSLTGARMPSYGKQYKNLAIAKEAGITPSELKERAEELWAKPFYQEHGLDWGNVVNSFNRK